MSQEEPYGLRREEYYLAQIAAEVRRGIAKHPKKVHMKDFILDFEKKKVEDQDSTKRSKQFWFAFAGIKEK